MTPDEIRRAVETGDIAALGRAQSLGLDIRPKQPEPEHYHLPPLGEITVGEFSAAVDWFRGRLLADAPTGPLSPDCRASKHTACTGDAWDDQADHLTPCGCTCHHGGTS